MEEEDDDEEWGTRDEILLTTFAIWLCAIVKWSTLFFSVQTAQAQVANVTEKKLFHFSLPPRTMSTTLNGAVSLIGKNKKQNVLCERLYQVARRISFTCWLDFVPIALAGLFK